MCVYSAYVTEVNKQWPGLGQPMPGINNPGTIYSTWPPVSTPTTDPRILQEILDIGKRLDRIDKALGLKDCTQEAAAKKAFEDRLNQLITDAKALKQSVECENGKCDVNSSASSGFQQQLAGVTSGGVGYQSSGSSGISLGDRTTGKAEAGSIGTKGILSRG